MKHGSLFSGIGGFDLAAEWMGWQNKFHCEWNEFGQRILKHYWPNAESFNDITKTDFKPYANRIDILTGGFPCQPYSLAGKRKGKEDERHLWPEMLRAIREIQPRWVVGENVFGLINWSGGLVFHEVQVDLETAGYEVWPYVLPAVSVNAPHRRDRVWFVAYSRHNSKGKARNSCTNEGSESTIIHKEGQGGERQAVFNSRSCNLSGNVTYPHSNGQFGSNSEHEVNASERGQYAQRNIEQMGSGVNANTCFQGREGDEQFGINAEKDRQWGKGFSGSATKLHRCTDWSDWPTQPPVCTGNDGIPTKLDGITFPKWRNESIKAAGNAIVPQVALQIFKAIEAYEN